MKIYLRTLSPVHIGTGDNLHSLDYVLKGSDYYRISQTQFTHFLKSRPNFEAVIDQFITWISDITEKIETLEFDYKNTRDFQQKKDYNQQLRDLRKKLQLDLFCKQENIEREFFAFMDNPQHGVRKYKLNGNTKQQVRSLITTANNDLYLPGSTLKGSLRTALMYQVLADDRSGNHKHTLIEDINRCLSDRQIRPAELRKKMGRDLEYSIAFCGQLDRRKKESYQDEKMDLFKFLEVSDAVFVSGDRPVEVVASDLYLVSKPGNSFGQVAQKAPMVALKQPQAPGMEAIRPGITFLTEVSINVSAMYAIYSKLPKTGREHWIDMEKKVKALYGIDLPLITRDNLQEHQAKADAYLHQAITRFATAQALFDQEWVTKQMVSRDFDRGMPDKKVFQAPFDHVAAYQHNGRTLLRTGFSTGFAGKTEMLHLLQDEDLRTAFKKVMKALELGKRPGVRDAKPYEPKLETFPKSRLLITYPDKSVSPLGWLELIPDSKWEKVKDEAQPKITVPIADAAKPAEPIKPQYVAGKIKTGSILDAFVFNVPGPEKKVRVYVGKGNDVDLMISYRADVILGKIILVEVTGMEGELVTAVKFKGMKGENR